MDDLKQDNPFEPPTTDAMPLKGTQADDVCRLAVLSFRISIWMKPLLVFSLLAPVGLGRMPFLFFLAPLFWFLGEIAACFFAVIALLKSEYSRCEAQAALIISGIPLAIIVWMRIAGVY